MLAFSENNNGWKPNLIEGSDISVHANQIIRQYKIQRMQQKQ